MRNRFNLYYFYSRAALVDFPLFAGRNCCRTTLHLTFSVIVSILEVSEDREYIRAVLADLI